MNHRPTVSPGEHDERIQQELLTYLRENPGAMDTLEGIAAWWLPRHEIKVGVECVARALERLRAQGLVERFGDLDRPLFRLCLTPNGSDEHGPSR